MVPDESWFGVGLYKLVKLIYPNYTSCVIIKPTRTYLSVMVLLVIYEAGVGDARLTYKGLVVPVGSSRQNGGLTDLANHQNLHHM